MSSGLLDSTIRNRQADNVAHGRWSQPVDRTADYAPRDRAGVHLHLQVELPSRRWYIEATREVMTPE